MFALQPLCRFAAGTLLAGLMAVLTGCATAPQPYDYTALREAKPASVLVLPPVNATPDVQATPSVWSLVTMPLAESGYYVVPVSWVDEALRNNGIQSAEDAQHIPVAKLREIFGADAGLYLKVTQYGSVYKVLSSETTVALEAKLVDLRTGRLLWEGQARASSAEQNQGNSGGLVGMLVQALVEQVVASTTNRSHGIANLASQRLLTAAPPRGLLVGPRSPYYGRPQ